MMSELLGTTSDKRDQLDNDPANPGHYGTAPEVKDPPEENEQGREGDNSHNYLTYQEATRTPSSQSKYLFYENKAEEKQGNNYLYQKQTYQNNPDNQNFYQNGSEEKDGENYSSFQEMYQNMKDTRYLNEDTDDEK